MGKRRRLVVASTSSRPVDKRIVSILKTGVTNTQQTTTLVTAATACTVFGIRWSFWVQGDAGTEGTQHPYAWAIVRQREGTTLVSLNTGDANTFYTPEQDVLAFGYGTSRSDASTTSGVSPTKTNWNDKSGSKRKLIIGDKIVFIINGIATETVRCEGSIQLFCKF